MTFENSFETELYHDPLAAESAVERLHALGYAREDISVMMDDKTRERAFAALTNSKGSEGAATGAAVGGVLGAIVAGMTATGSVAAIVGTGGLATPLVAGPLAAALVGLGAGGVAGGVIGGLIGLGVGEHRAKEYEQGLRDGGILVAIKPKAHHDQAQIRTAFGNERLRNARTGELDASVDYAGQLPGSGAVRQQRG